LMIWVFCVVTRVARLIVRDVTFETSRKSNSATRSNNPEDRIMWDCKRWKL